MSKKNVKQSKGNNKFQLMNSAGITQIVCFAIVATAAVFGFVQARRAVYEFGKSSRSVISEEKYSHGDGGGFDEIKDDGGDGASYFTTTTTRDSVKKTSANEITSGNEKAQTTTTERTTEKTGTGTTMVYSDYVVKITASPVNIRSGAGTGKKVIERTTRGRIYELLASDRLSDGKEWYQIALDGGKKGWILSTCCRILNKSELETTTTGNTSSVTRTDGTTTVTTTKSTTTASTTTTTTKSADGERVEIKATPVNIRSGAGANYKTIARARKGDLFRVVSKEKDSAGNEWYQVPLDDGKTGWVKGSLCNPVNGDTNAETTAKSTTTKSTTAKSTTAKSTTTKSTTTKSTTTKSTTAKSTTTKSTTTKSTTAKSTTKSATGKSVEISVSPVNIRSGPGMGYSIIERTARGETFGLISIKKNRDGKEWCKISLGGDKTGWILRSCCRVNGEDSDTTTAKSKDTTTTKAKSTTTSKSTTASKTTTTKAEEKLIMSLQPEEHNAKYFVVVYKGSQSVVVYGKDDNGDYTKSVKTFTCSTGKKSSPTRTGKYRIRAKYRWRWLVGDVYGQYNSSISSDYLFHSVPYYERDASTLENGEYDKLGTPASKGCIRMCVRDCKWIYDNCAIGTDVRIINDSGPDGPGVPKRRSGQSYSGWDPSDKWTEGNPYFS